METRSRKRAEGSSTAPSSSSTTTARTTRSASTKRTRLSSISHAATSVSVNTRCRSRSSINNSDSSMEPHPVNESSSGSRRDRRGRNNSDRDRDSSDKGKEKEHDVRVRDRDRRLVGLNIVNGGGGGGDDDDVESDGEDGIMHENLNSASSALQGLLRKLGIGFDDLIPMSGSGSSAYQDGRFKKILTSLRADGEEGPQVEALTQLCEMLSIASEDSLSSFSVDSFVPVLVGLLNHESNPDVMLLAARALTHLCDVLPSSCTAVLHYGAVPIFCARLLTIEYMDLAEQSLQALKKISQEHPTACLRAGALMAVLSYLDFFSTGVQRVALSTAANMCKKLPSDAADFVMEAVPLLTNLLQYHDAKDEELNISPVEIEDDDISEDDISDDDEDDHEEVLRDDSLPVCSPDKVHDVKLGDPAESTLAAATNDSLTNVALASSSKVGTARESDSADFKSGHSSSSRGAMSFAAAMAGLGYANTRGFRGGRDRHGRLFGSSNEPPKLIFSAGGKQLNRNLTVYQAVQRQLVLDEDDDDRFARSDLISSDGSGPWGETCTITYQRAENQTNRDPTGGSSSNTSKAAKSGSSSNFSSEAKLHQTSVLDSILQGELPCDLEKSNPTYNILALLRVLEGLNQLAPRLRAQMVNDQFAEGKIFDFDELGVTAGARVSPEEFVSSKITPKLARQIQDALVLCSGSLPSWCNQLTKACPFLFPFETRRQYFYSTAFGLSRALNRLQQQQGAEGLGSTTERATRVGRLQRQKVRVSRNRILDSAAKVMEMYSSQKAVLEVEYFGEVGTGLGPTLEFYTILSHDLQKVRLQMWRSYSSEKHQMEVDGDEKKMKSCEGYGPNVPGDGELVQAPMGLFPRPWPTNADASVDSQFTKVVEYFRLLGRVMAKALQDGRLLDLPLSVAFYKLILGQDLDLHDIVFIDAELGKTLQELNAIVRRKHHMKSICDNSNDANTDFVFRGTQIEDLCLDFTLPGYPEYILKPGDDIVDINNLEEYVSLVVDATVKNGITRQMEAFRAGFNQVFDISSLQIFNPQELDNLLCGRRELWEVETLTDHIKFDHGYTAKSPAIINLLTIMGEFTPEQQRAFCQFVTGAPRLPPGGLAVLNPKLTIVRKLSSTAVNTTSNGNVHSESADDDLPSVMTCANYLKLPPYSTKEIMYKKLLYAISEGQGSFDLS
ncbi:E3 ubiquitin-protein ligase UPL3-like isoform X2 [Vicia villosa]|uniref:E3 ubiquitin-protein ligase UPL3-like isoform X2 n=1 Tax=Vicia villosa TaxID=3911 RepID=UPI00273CA1E5|nr:E3 ubiquitin-protein ligase UPL3-like isoform X2 [Vicia villosa]